MQAGGFFAPFIAAGRSLIQVTLDSASDAGGDSLVRLARVCCAVRLQLFLWSVCAHLLAAAQQLTTPFLPTCVRFCYRAPSTFPTR